MQLDKLKHKIHGSYGKYMDDANIIEKLNRCLTEQERNVIKLRFGLEGTLKTYTEISQIMGISRQRAAACVRSGIRRMKLNRAPLMGQEATKLGFAAMDPEVHRIIASKGGKRAQELGKSHHFTSEEAKIAGQKGGSKIGQDRNHMAQIGRIGGLVKKKK